MPSVRLDKMFFKKERNQAYADWKIAVWRELFQNAIDQNATRIDIGLVEYNDSVVLSFSDNGPGMSREVLENVYFAVGATTKNGPNHIGGMGRARILTCFAMESYIIRSHHYEVHGKGGDYDVLDTPSFHKGCQLIIEIDGATIQEMNDTLNEFLGESKLPAQVYINGDRANITFFQGKFVTDLSVMDQPFGKVYVNKSAEKHRIIVRVNGVSMFSQESHCNAQIVVELVPAISKDALTSNRDSLKGAYRIALADFVHLLAVDTRATLKDKFTRHTKIISGGGMKKMRRPSGGGRIQSTIYVGENNKNVAPIRVSPHNIGDDVTEVPHDSIDTFSSWLADTFGDIYIVDETDNAKVHKVLPNYLPENWKMISMNGKSCRKGGNIVKVLLMWQTAIKYALDVSYDLLGGDELSYAVGFIFKNDTVATHQARNGGHVFSINPVCLEGKLKYSVRNKQSLKLLMSAAKHEITHILYGWHNEDFVILRERIDEIFDEAECFRRMKVALDSTPSFDDAETSVWKAA